MKTTGLQIRKRIASLFFVFVAVICILAGRFFWLQVVRGDELAERALDNRMRDITVKAKRGILYDRNGRELAISISTDSVYAVPAEIRRSKKEREIARKLAEILEMDEDKIYERITRQVSFIWVKRQVDFETSQKLRELDLDGIGLSEESRRFYPKGKLACHILGISGIDNTGLDGIDLYYDDIIGGTDGRILIEHDAWGREIPEATHRYVPPVDGSDLVLTIDETIQYILERELDKAVELRQPKAACGIVMDPKTGEILAMASRPSFDPNSYNDYPASNRRNFAVNDAYEPGSTMKVTTAAAAMEEGVVKSGDRFFCPGSIKVANRSISCAGGTSHGSMDFNGVVEHSCNVGFINMGLKLGLENYYRYLNAFGFGQKTGIDIPGEAKGITVPKSRATQVDLATMSFGQANAVTPIQLITAASAIANGGTLMKPHLLKQVLTPDGEVKSSVTPTKVRQVISKETADELCLVLEGVVQNGSGRNAYVEGYRVAGKTGTAQKIAPGGGYMSNEYVASFLGIAPANDPRLVCLVVIDAPQGYPYYGGWVAAPVVREVMADSLRYLEVPRSELSQKEESKQTKTVKVPDVINLPIDEAVQTLRKAGLNAQVQGDGDLVWSQVPKSNTTAKQNSRVIVYLSPVEEQEGSGQVTIPDLEGKTMKEVARVLSQLGLHLSPDGHGLAFQQTPKAGTRVPVGSTIKVSFQPLE
ncbi:MAG: stage V sporulation protein D [Syntrophomonadales bacterium]|jgi:stage V sporulation protein D (sporulation-specific penicillin-binding protein)